MQETRARRVRAEIEHLLETLRGLSRFCGVWTGEYQLLAEGLLKNLAEGSRLEEQGQSSAEADMRARRLYSNLCNMEWERTAAVGDWQDWVLDRLLADDHAFLQCCEICVFERIPSVLVEAMKADLDILHQLAKVEVEVRIERFDQNGPLRGGDGRQQNLESRNLPWCVQADLHALKKHLRRAADWADEVETIAAFVYRHKHGIFCGCPAFRLNAASGGVELAPIEHFAHFPLEWLEGNEQRVRILEENTRNLLQGYSANNVLIWGPRGGGKSSLIRGLIARYYGEGLRAIEIYPSSYEHLVHLFSLVRGRPERFIGVLDNISMDRRDPGFRYLSRILDGGLEQVPTNLVFYATSNYKDLVDREGERPQGLGRLQVDRDGGEVQPNLVNQGMRPNFYDPQQSERLDEQRALDDRFALKVFIDMPGKGEYEKMMLSYARRAGIDVDEGELLAAFNIWRMRHNHDLVGGRTARDFIVSFYPGYACAKAGELA